MVAKMVALGNHKGGSGKTTGAMSLAGALVRQHSVLVVVDADELPAATKWAGPD